jgi:hypothetical protein
MGLFRRIAALFGRRRRRRIIEAPLLDNIYVPPPATDWRTRKLAEAAQKYGRPFKCAGGDMPRQVVQRDRVIIVDAERIA